MIKKQRATGTGTTTKATPPERYSLIMMNDEVTPLIRVIDVLTNIFGYSSEAALTLARKAEANGGVIIKKNVEKEECRRLIRATLQKASTLGITMKKEK